MDERRRTCLPAKSSFPNSSGGLLKRDLGQKHLSVSWNAISSRSKPTFAFLQSAAFTMKIMKGLSPASLKGHPSLIPLFVCVSAGMVGAFGYLYRLASRNPDVCIDRKNNPYPWEKLDPTHQYKFYSPTRDYSKLSHPDERPKI